MKKEIREVRTEGGAKEPYHEPLLLKHEPLLDITGTKSGEKITVVKTAEIEKPTLAEDG
jgi:hypothetical protein